MPNAAHPVGPVDIAVIGFPFPDPPEALAAVLAATVASGTVRLLDAIVVQKDGDGSVTIIDVDDPADTLDAIGYQADIPGLLAEADAIEVAGELPEGTSAVVLAWENIWAVRLRQALDEMGGVVATHERIDTAEVAAALAAVGGPDGTEEGDE